MEAHEKIPTGKVERASKFASTTLKVGTNYVKHYTKKLFNPDLDRGDLDKENAEDIYKALGELKGSALKVAQMISMDKRNLPEAYSDVFSLSQYNAPPLSGPLIVKTFTKYLGKSPQKIYDHFEMTAVNAASIGQVHQASLNGKKLAVKIQYPGVAESVKSDLKMVKMVGKRILRIKLSDEELNKYLNEVQERLLEETDYTLELKRSIEFANQCKQIDFLRFPVYYPDYSSEKIITMEWMSGMHLREFLSTNPSQDLRNLIGQHLWDFYDYQFHKLQMLHSDPHPGNFFFNDDGTVGVIDFGCVKIVPRDFYNAFFSVLYNESLSDEDLLAHFKLLEFIREKDSPEERDFFFNLFKTSIKLFSYPLRSDIFDFGTSDFFDQLYDYGEKLSKDKHMKDSTVGRASKHFLYVNRTLFGCYSLLNELKAVIKPRTHWTKAA